MAEVIVKETEYKNYGKCIEVNNGTVKVIVTLDVGPRIINYSFISGENIMWEDIKREKTIESPKEMFGDIFYNYGGHRLWTSPEETPRTYYPDNNPVKYEKLSDGVRVVQEVQKWNQVQCEFTVSLSPEGSDVKVYHKITNLGAWDVKFAPWALSVLSQGGLEIIPQPTVDTGDLSNRQIAIWPYTKIYDDRITWGHKYISVRQDTSAEGPMKFGINSEHGFAMYFNHGDLFVKKFDLVKDGKYPDGGMSFETYNCAEFIEMESLGEYKTVPAGGFTDHCEYWSLFKCERPEGLDEDKIDGLVEKYVK